jgi:hypothetical protein
MNKSHLLLLLFSLFITFSCSKKTVLVKSSNEESVKRTLEELKVKNFDFDYFSSRAKIMVEDGNNKINGKVNIRIKRDSLIWMSVTPGLGIEVIRAKITTDSIHVINYMEKTYNVYDYKYINNLLNMEVNFGVLQSIIVGNMPFSKHEADEVNSDSSGFVLKQNSGLFSIDNTIEPGNMKLKKLRIVENPTKNSIDIEYKDFQPIDEEVFPYQSQINLKYRRGKQLKNAQILLNHIKAELTNKELSFPFSVPSKYENK